MTSVQTSRRSIESKLDSLTEQVAELRGRLAHMPTWLQLITLLITAWAAGAATAATAIHVALK